MLKGSRPSLVISRPDLGVIWHVDPERRTYREMPLPSMGEWPVDPAVEGSWELIGDETIDGVICDMYQVSIPVPRAPPDPTAVSIETIYVDRQTGMRRRVVTHSADGDPALVLDYQDALVAPPAATWFCLPPGLRRERWP
jgi:hypothetical protein